MHRFGENKNETETNCSLESKTSTQRMVLYKFVLTCIRPSVGFQVFPDKSKLGSLAQTAVVFVPTEIKLGLGANASTEELKMIAR